MIRLNPMTVLMVFFGGATIGAALSAHIGGEGITAVMGLGLALTGVLGLIWRDT